MLIKKSVVVFYAVDEHDLFSTLLNSLQIVLGLRYIFDSNKNENF
jgi:hypothetical protein